MNATLASIARSRKVARVWDDRENGLWASLRPGWKCASRGTHTCHEQTIGDLARAVRNAVRCDCKACHKEQLFRTEQLGGMWLYLGNLASERGDHALAEKHYAKAQKQLDRMNELLGNN